MAELSSNRGSCLDNAGNARVPTAGWRAGTLAHRLIRRGSSSQPRGRSLSSVQRSARETSPSSADGQEVSRPDLRLVLDEEARF
jgi:hypothetical protein